MQRRDVLGMGLLPLLSFMNEAQAAPKTSSDWMDAAIREIKRTNLAKSLDKPATFTRFADPTYIVREEFSWEPDSNEDPELIKVTVPVGFVTDLASIPPILFPVLRADGDYAQAAVVHDYLYWFQPVQRAVADRIFKRAMLNLEVSSTQANSIYDAVSTFGGKAWKDNQRLKQNGEKRVLKRFPDKANTRWKDWKQNPENFA